MIRFLLFTVMLLATTAMGVAAQDAEQEVEAKKYDKLMDAVSRLHIGGYGEAVMTRNFYSQSFNRYKYPEKYKDDKSHGR